MQTARGYHYEYRRRAIDELPAGDATRPQAYWATVNHDFDVLPAGEALFFDLPGDFAPSDLRVAVQRMRGRIKKQFDHYRPKLADIRLDYGPPAGVWVIKIGERTAPPISMQSGTTDRDAGEVIDEIMASAQPSPPLVDPQRFDDPERYFTPNNDAAIRDRLGLPAADADTETPAALETESETGDISDDTEIVCGCPDWWKESGTYIQGAGADVAGNHHHESCRLHTRERAPDAPPVCLCDPYFVGGRYAFKAEIANEAHLETCPMYLKGGHRWKVPAGASPYLGYTETCAWCGETREHPATGEEYPKDDSAKREERRRRGRPPKAKEPA